MNIEITGYEEVIDTLEKLKEVEKPVMEALEHLMQQARLGALALYAAQWEAGNADYNAEVLREPDGIRLRMFGEDIGFLEFGAGVSTEADDFAEQVDYAVSPGSYSEEHEGMFSQRGFWYWHKRRFTGMTPTRGMQRAWDYVNNHVYETVEKAIKEWIG